MNYISRSLLTALAGAAFVITTGCQEQNGLTARSKGALSFSVEWPQAKSGGFVVQAIPDATRRIDISIDGEGLAEPIKKTVTRDAGESKDSVIIDVPTGRKVVKVEAFDAKGLPLAVDVRTVVIVGGQTQRLEMTMQPLGVEVPKSELIVPPTSQPGVVPAQPASNGQIPTSLLPIPLSPATTPLTPDLPTQPGALPPALQPAPVPALVPVPINPPVDTNTSSDSSSGSSSGSSGSSTADSPVVPAITSFTPSSGLAGTAVTLTGTNFNKVASVAFNGTNAVFTIVSDTQITTTVPAGAVTGGINLSTGVVSASSGTFTVITPVENLRIEEVLGVYDNSNSQYIELKNSGATAVNASGLLLRYTDDTGALKDFTIPTTPPLAAGGSLVVRINQNGANTASTVFTGTSGFPHMKYDAGVATEIMLCKASPCASNNILSYLSFGIAAVGANASLATGATPALWTGGGATIGDTTAPINVSNLNPGDGGIGITLGAATSGVFAAGETVVIQDGTTASKYSSTVAATAAVSSTSIQISTPPKANINASNTGDGALGGAIQVDSTANFAANAWVKVRGQQHQISALSANAIQFAAPLKRDADPNNSGSGVADALNTSNNVIVPAGAPSAPANNTFFVNDLVKLEAKTVNEPGHAQVRTVTASNTNGFNIDSPFASMQFSASNTGSGNTSNVAMASTLPAGLSLSDQFWGGRDDKRFSIATLPGGLNVQFNIDFSNCPITATTGNGAAATPIVTGTCLGGSTNMRVGDYVKVTDNSTQSFFSTISAISGTQSSYTITLTTPGGFTPTGGWTVKTIPQMGTIHYIPYTKTSPTTVPDKLILTPRSGDIKFVPRGGSITLKKALKLGTCASIPNAGCYSFSPPSH
jgi:hypothetical protein